MANLSPPMCSIADTVRSHCISFVEKRYTRVLWIRSLSSGRQCRKDVYTKGPSDLAMMNGTHEFKIHNGFVAPQGYFSGIAFAIPKDAKLVNIPDINCVSRLA